MKNKILLIIVIAILGLASCEDFLEETPKQAVGTNEAITNTDDAQVALNGCYDGLQEIELYARDYMVISDIAADNSKLNTSNSGRFVNIYQWNIIESDGYLEGIWDYGYQTIDRTNRLIQALSEIEIDPLLQADADRILGEAKFVRALMYHMFCNIWGQPYSADSSKLAVPLILRKSDDPTGTNPGRNTLYEVYSQILLDLEGNAETKGAVDLLNNATSQNDAVYASKGAAQALLSRVYLYMERWSKAKDYAQEVINSGVYALVQNQDFISSWEADQHAEQIFYLKFTDVDYWSVDMLGNMYINSGYGDILPTTDLLDLFESNDIRNGWFKEEDDDVTYINKYPGRESKDGVDNIPVLRLAEMYLNLAEAEYHLGNETEAQGALNNITSRAMASAPLEKGPGLLTKILTERRKELCFEGHRLWDIQRTKGNIIRKDLTGPGIIKLIEFPTNKYAYPIPEREMEVNDVIAEQQNPGY